MVDFFLIDRTQPASTHAEGVDAVIGEAIDDAARASHAYYEKAVTGSVDASSVSDSQTSEYRRFLRAAFIKFTGTLAGSPAQITYTVPAVEKLFHFWNATNTDVTVQIATGGSTYTVRSGLCLQLYATGSSIVRLSDPDIMNLTEASMAAADYLWMFRASSASLAKVLGSNLGLSGGSSSPPTFRGALVYNSADQSVSDLTDTTLSWDSEDYDTDAFHSGGDPTKLVVPAGVTKVRLSASLNWDVNATNYRRSVFQKNGAAFLGNGELHHRPQTDSAFVKVHHMATPPVEVSAGDYFTLMVRQNSGGTRTVAANSGYDTWMCIQVIES